MSTDIDKLIQALEAPAERKGVRTQLEDQMRGQDKPACQRGGRLPVFYRSEVNMILADHRTLREIAETWQVSLDTISRVKQLGRFRTVPYIARDEIDRTLAYNGMRLQKTMKDQHDEVTAARPERYRRGRPFASGREPLTEADKLAIAMAEGTVQEIAADSGVSPTYVKRLRRDYIMEVHRSKRLSPALVQAIIADTREVTAIAVAFKIPSALIIEIKAGRYDRVGHI